MAKTTDTPGAGTAAAFTPNRVVSANTMRLLMAVQAGAALAFWWSTPFEVLPSPVEVLTAVRSLWFEQGLGAELITSFGVNLQALALTLAISLALSYLTVVPF